MIHHGTPLPAVLRGLHFLWLCINASSYVAGVEGCRASTEGNDGGRAILFN